MVAIFTGVGAGFERGSRAALGSVGLLGSASFGRDGQGIFLNAANGNLLVTDQDEFLVGRGPDVGISRTYNSMGALDENGDHWRQSTDRRVFDLTGTVNTSGSTVRRVSSDGSEVVYVWNGSHYAANTGDGATDRLTYVSSEWIWTDGGSQITETYGAYGTNNWRITGQADSDGNALTFAYTSDKLTQITTEDGGYIAYTWSGSNITSIATGYTDLETLLSETLTRTHYLYDGLGRLETVRTDLTPDDSSISDSNFYQTLYTYHGSSKLVASITQTDGAQLDITYDARGRVTQIDQAVAGGDTRTTTVDYFAFRTVVTDPAGQETTLNYNAAGQLTKITAPPAQSGDAPQIVEFEYAFPPGNLSRQGEEVVVPGEAAYGGVPVDWTFATEVIDGREVVTARKPSSYLQPWDNWNHPGSIYLKGGDRPDGSISVTAGETVGYRFAVNMLDGANYAVSDIAFFDVDGNEVDYAGSHWNSSSSGWSENTGYAVVPEGVVAAFIQVRPMDYGAPSSTAMGLAVADIQFYKLPTGATSVPGWAPSPNLMWGGDLSAGTSIIDDGLPAPGGTPTPWEPTIATVGGLEALSVMKDWGYLDGDWNDPGSFLLAGGDRTDGAFSVRPGEVFSYRFSSYKLGGADHVISAIEFVDETGAYVGDGGWAWNSTWGWSDNTGSAQVPTGAVAAKVHVSPRGWAVPSLTAMGAAVRNIEVHKLPFGSSTIPQWNDPVPLGALLRVTDNAGAQTRYTYDVNGNISAITDANNNTLQRTYDSSNNLIRETQIASSASLSSGSVHTRYVYDAENHLRYAISGEGRVTEYLYTPAGQLEFTRQYTAAAHLYAIDDDVPSLTTMDSWRDGLADRSSVKNQEIRYDARGNVIEMLTWGDSTSVGAPSSAEGYAHQYFVYDQAGQLRNRHVAGQQTETFVYDGMGRVTLSTDLAGGTTHFLFDDDDRTTVVTTAWDAGETASSYTTTSVFNKAGDLLTRTDAGSTADGDFTNGGTTTYVYDKNGQVRKAANATGDSYFLYDKVGRKIADIGHDGQITEYQYDEAGRLIATVRYANLVSGGDVADLSNMALDIEVADIRPSAHASDIWQWTVYDDGGRVIQTIAGDGGVTHYQYDQASRLVSTTSYYNKLTASGFIASPPATLTLPTTHAKDSVSRVFYDRDGKVVGALNPEGGLSQIFYDGAGQKIREIAYSDITDASLRASGTFGELLASVEPDGAKDISTRHVYDGQGLLRWTIDALNRVVEYVYWEDTATLATGLVRKTIAYATAIDPLGSYDYDSVKTEVASVASANDRTSFNVYNDRALLSYAVDALGGVTAFAYDIRGRVIKTTQFAIAASMGSMGDDEDWKTNLDTWASTNGAGARISRTYYTERGEVAYTVDAEGFATSHGYDDEGRLVSQSRYTTAISVSDSSTIVNVATALTGVYVPTSFTYDGLGRVYEATDATGTVTRTLYYGTGTKQSVTVAQGQGRDESRVVYSYDTAGKLLQTRYADGAAEEAVESYTYDGLGNLLTVTDANSGVTTFAYDKAGRVVSQTNPLSGVTQTAYDTLGRAVMTTDPRGASSYSFYDQVGRIVAVVDSEGYVTRTTYNAFGEVASVTRHANKETAIAVSHWLAGGGYNISREVIDGDLVITGRNTGGEFPGWAWAPWGGEIRLYEGNRPDGRIAVTAGDVIDVSVNVTPLASGVVTHAKVWWLLSDNSEVDGGWVDGATGEWETLSGTVIAPTNAVAVHLSLMSYRPDGNTAGVFDFAFTDLSILKNSVSVIEPKPRVAASADDAATTFQYDKLGRTTRITDAEGAYEEFTLDAFGQRTSVRNKLGGVTTNTYDLRGFLIEEELPIETHDEDGVLQSSSVINQFEYDAYGNQTAMIEAVGLAEERNTTYTYDAVGRIISKSGDAVSAATSSIGGVSTVTPTETYTYDRRGNVIASEDANGAVTLNWYDKLDRLTHTVSPLGTLMRNFYDDAGNLTESRVYATLLSPVPGDALGTAPAGAGTYRATEYTYDALGRMTESRVQDIETARYTSSLAVVTQDLVSTFEYDAAGNVVRVTDANGGQTWSWYDRLGRKTFQIDAANYRTDWSYDSDGNVVEEVRYSTASTTPSDLDAPPAAPSATADDRVTTFTYDKMGRRTSETREAVKVHNGSGGHTTSNATISYTYNGLGQVTQKTEATGDAIAYTYDTGGRLTQEERSAYIDYSGNWAAPTVDYRYDGLGNLTRSRQWGATGTWERVTKYTYGAGGRLASVEDAEAFVRDHVYDATGRVIREEYTLGSDRSAVGYDYDLEGRVIQQGVVAYVSSAWGRTGLDYVTTTYNAFGEVATRGLNGTSAETFDYDAAGRLWRTTTGDGTWKYFMYDASGNQTLAIASDGMDLSNKTLTWVLDRWGATRADIATTNVADIVATITKYDARNQAVEVREPQREIHVSGSLTLTNLTSQRAYNAFGEISYEINTGGHQIDYLYNTMGRQIEIKSPTVSVTTETGSTSSVRPTEHRYYDVSGRLVASRDANSNLTRLSLLSGSGYGASQALVTSVTTADSAVVETGYDVHGDARLITDQIGRETSQLFDKLGRLLDVEHESGLVEYHRYDALGQKVRRWNNQLGWSNSEILAYDRQGRLVSHTAMGGDVTTFAYEWRSDIATAGLGDFDGWRKTTTYANSKTMIEDTDQFGREVSKTDLGTNVSASTYDYAGRIVERTGGEAINYAYFNTGRLASIETDVALLTIPYEQAMHYFRLNPDVEAEADDFVWITDQDGDSDVDGFDYAFWHYDTFGVSEGRVDPEDISTQHRTTYAYDAAGNLLQEDVVETVYNGALSLVQTIGWKDADATYDALGRMLTWSQAAGASPAASTSFAYDANGNIRKKESSFHSLDAHGVASGSPVTTENWYAYDSLNRVVIDGGGLDGGVIVGGTQIAYDDAGQRAYTLTPFADSYGGTYYNPETGMWEIDPEGPGPTFFTNYRRENYIYDAGGRLDQVRVNEGYYDEVNEVYVPPTTGGTLRGDYSYDLMGRMLTQIDYQADGTTVAYSRTLVYNDKSQITSDTTATRRGSMVYQSVSTSDYGSGSGYALGQALTVTSVNTQNGGSSVTSLMTNTYVWGDGPLQSLVTYQPNTSSGTTNNSAYHYKRVGGATQLISVTINDGRDRNVAFENDLAGQAMRRDEDDWKGLGNPHEVYYLFGGKQLGYIGNNGGPEAATYGNSIGTRTQAPSSNAFRGGTSASFMEFDSAVRPINSYNHGSDRGLYTARGGETLASIAANTWGDASLWFKIAEANGLNGQAALMDGQQLVIPAGVMRSTFNASTFTPYDPASVMGDTAPTAPVQPKPFKGKCGAFGQILLTVIAVAITTIVSAGVAGMFSGSGFLGGITNAIASPGLSLAQLAGGGVQGFIAGAAGGVAGSIASQRIGVANGLQERFSWNQVALSGLSAGLGGASETGPLDPFEAAARGMAVNMAAQTVGLVAGWQGKFDFAGVAAAGVGAAAGFQAGSWLAGAGAQRLEVNLGGGSASALANAATRSLVDGSDFGDNIRAALPDVIGSIIGTAVAEAVQVMSWQADQGPVVGALDAFETGGGVSSADRVNAAMQAAGIGDMSFLAYFDELNYQLSLLDMTPEERTLEQFALGLVDGELAVDPAMFVKGYGSIPERPISPDAKLWRVMLSDAYFTEGSTPSDARGWFLQNYASDPDRAFAQLTDGIDSRAMSALTRMFEAGASSDATLASFAARLAAHDQTYFDPIRADGMRAVNQLGIFAATPYIAVGAAATAPASGSAAAGGASGEALPILSNLILRAAGALRDIGLPIPAWPGFELPAVTAPIPQAQARPQTQAPAGTKVHGNSYDSQEPTEVYHLINVTSGVIDKIGITSEVDKPNGRYTAEYLSSHGVRYQEIVTYKSRYPAVVHENIELMHYWLTHNLDLPRLNKTFR
jgi:YD repeat-containing protein